MVEDTPLAVRSRSSPDRGPASLVICQWRRRIIPQAEMRGKQIEFEKMLRATERVRSAVRPLLVVLASDLKGYPSRCQATSSRPLCSRSKLCSSTGPPRTSSEGKRGVRIELAEPTVGKVQLDLFAETRFVSDAVAVPDNSIRVISSGSTEGRPTSLKKGRSSWCRSPARR